MIAVAVDSPAMPEKKATEQIGLRLDKALLDKLREYANAHPMQPSLTQLLNLAMREWLERHAEDKRRK